jgi:nucleoid-associated protein YgaU
MIMPVKPDSRFARLPVLEVVTPDGKPRRVIALRLVVPPVSSTTTQHLVIQGEAIDLLARRFYGDEKIWWRILDANPVVYPLDIKPGDVLNLPAPGPITRATRARSF